MFPFGEGGLAARRHTNDSDHSESRYHQEPSHFDRQHGKENLAVEDSRSQGDR